MEFTEVRKKVIEKDYINLNNMQKAAVFNTSGPLLVIAGAGSGKTTVIINKIGHLIKYGDAYSSEYVDSSITSAEQEVLEWYASGEVEEIPRDLERFLSVDPIKPYNILAITFTNKAAAELKARITARLGACGEDVWASTFHSMCVRFLRRDIEKIGYDKNFAIFDTADQQTVIKECLKELNIDEKSYSPRSVLSVISRAKDELMDCDEFENRFAGDFYREKIAAIYRLYQKKLKSYNALDFDDIIFNTVRLFEENSEVLEYYQNKFKYILVDEYQDTNSAQYRLIALLADKYKNICVVGDDDQSIYKFRGANIQNILSFEREFDGAKVIKLEENYRSTKNILGAANSVIKNNDGRRGKSLWTQNDDGEKVTVYNAENEHDEGYFIAKTIEENTDSETAYNDYAVLYRMNAQSRVIEESLMRNAIPYRVIGGLRFYDRKEIKDLTAYLRLIQNTNDNVALKRIINEPKRGIGGTTVEKIENIASNEDVSMFEICRRAGEFEEISRASGKVSAFAAMIEDIISKMSLQNLEELVNTVLAESQMISALNADNTVESKTRIENLNEFISMVQEEMKNDELITLDELLEKISLVSDIDNYNEAQDTVVLMTLHSAKGLEFPYVFLAGVEEGVFPGTMALGNPEEMEEERRLCYVGITRAKKKLYITHAKSRVLFGRTTYNMPSRFINEISVDFIERVASDRPKRDSAVTYYQTKEPVRGFGNSIFINTDKSSEKPLVENVPDRAFSFKEGDTVRHRKFGIGTVTSVSSMGRDMLVVVDFEKEKGKRLMATYARLEKVE